MKERKTKKKVAKKSSKKSSAMTPEQKIESGFKELYNREKRKEKKCKPKFHHCHHGSAFYFLGFIGALVYYLQTTVGFWNGVVGFLKACVWPAFLIFELMKYIGA